MRQTKYYKGYGYISGSGVLDNLLKSVKDVIFEGAKSAAKSAGDKAGAKLVEKVTKPPKPAKETPKPAKEAHYPTRTPKPKTTMLALKEIYGSGIQLLPRQRQRGGF